MKLQELLDYIEIDDVKGDTNQTIEGIYYNSQKVTPNSLFICIKGFKTDGHLYVEDAIKRGAVAILCEDIVETGKATMIKVKNTRKTMAAIANKFFDFPSKSIDLVGVTGTNGKTSVTYMIKSILEKSGRKTGLIGTIATLVDGEKIDATRTTPESLDLQKLFKKMKNVGIDSCVMEVSSHSLDLERVEEITYKVGVFTNLSPDHLDFHKDLMSYREAKKKLFYKTSLCNVINIDDADGKVIGKEVKKLDVPLLTYGIEEEADYVAKNIKMSFKEVTFDVVGPNFNETITLGIPVKFAIYNALAAIVSCHVLKVPAKEIVEALEEFKGVPGRFEMVKEIEKFSVIVDYAHTPDALENVLKAAKGFAKDKRVITVFGCGGDRDQTKRPVMGQISGELSDLTIITSDNPRTEDPKKILLMVEEGIGKTNGKYEVIEDRREAIKYALKDATEGDIVIIAGKGHEKTQVIGQEVLVFDDEQVAIEIAREEGLI
ncbi:UDP-N-acetylmuramoyl-L-alanyl-D-glutamate--2,6-diaminopimelate ligase [Alkaliphilus hydrothermalis]|uniref:UDP-N-acetylmuramoyl-L-alanyl-D-glutamate--2,6-diaminopimelate ligase n=1 Tax=Alkaliphilus hydrothermalis TaxID=1482730 RepID=A0ABS2NNV8_9FIRM|nr:UDP-N-acetylmuramoyl-L-alanyl-D-glutamate--2,6-diaminopimelate ligase [Alkaliphilus hydrothermalis]